MTTSADLLIDEFGRIREVVHDAVDGLTPDELAFRIDDQTNSIAWLTWHLSRIIDDHISEVAGSEQIWVAKGYMDKFGLPFGPRETGYGHGSGEVAAVQVKSGELLTAYHDAVYEMALRYVRKLTDEDLPRVVDDSWDPPVTLAVRLVSVISDGLQHAGQAFFVRGIVERR
ncbi:MAG TPA: DUF664 domain-containing protein [Streptosporangiaceae bacterium]|jgi:uncharacterized damage-inducible protein DinB